MALERYESVKDGVVMGGALSIKKEYESVKFLIEYICIEKNSIQAYLHDKPIRDKISQIEKYIAIRKKERGVLKALFGSDMEFNKYHEEIRQLRGQIKSDYSHSVALSFYNDSQITQNELIDIESKLNKYLIILNHSIEKSIERAKQRKILNEESKQRKEAKKAKQEEENERTKALAAAHKGNTRRHAISVKRQLSEQIKILPYCPYCGDDLGESPHADHIYPVSKGGLSTKENMVYVCQTCNKRKSDKTLIEFISSSMFYDLKSVIDNLYKLKKKI